MTDDQSDLIIGVDGGATKTVAVVARSDGSVIGEGRGGPSNLLRIGLPATMASIQETVKQACRSAGVDLCCIAAAGFGLAGSQNPDAYDRIRSALEETFDIPAIFLTTDAHIALIGATDGEPGVVIISGTGSIAFGMNRDGEQAQSGGWGPIMGDAGSAYDISRRALAAVMGAYDGRMPPTALTEKICQHLSIDRPTELVPIIYGESTGVSEIASLGEIVIEAAREGDEVAREIISAAGFELGRAVVAVIERLRLQPESFRVAYVGGVFNSGEIIIEPIRTTVAAVAPRAVLSPPLYPPAVGAVKFALGKLKEVGQAPSLSR